ncbi:hypothetical protein TSUD_189640 [Trifolium subterraneum]|uniref:Uncharacterized protein n=1 Tax=Trifolium subterraneum TaxID=3900 RepID=A0A2Z6LRT4_TRISU|nr:hypothetical protein TSUD_189640 [Trifolium subterraneum]
MPKENKCNWSKSIVAISLDVVFTDESEALYCNCPPQTQNGLMHELSLHNNAKPNFTAAYLQNKVF